jgi:hypothetical protein
MLWAAMIYMSAMERGSGWRQLCVHAQPCMQGSGDAACLLCMLGAVEFHKQLSVIGSTSNGPGTNQPSSSCAAIRIVSVSSLWLQHTR